MWYQTEVTKKLSIQYPIIQAPMAGGITTPELVAAVSNAGGLGMIGAGYMTVENLESVIRQIFKLTSKPFGVNLFVPENPAYSEEEIKRANEALEPTRKILEIEKRNDQVLTINPLAFEDQIHLVIKYNIPICSFTFGIPPRNVLEQLKEHGVITIGTATTVTEAEMIEAADMDMVSVQGSEAGGHRGSFAGPFTESMIGTMALIPQVADHVSIPVIAAGGIMDGRGVLSSLILGAQSVQMGTAFLTCIESRANELHKQRILNSSEDQAVITSAFSGKPARGIKNEFMINMQAYEHVLPPYPIQNMLTQDIRAQAAVQKNPEYMSLWCGQNPRLSKHIHAGELMKSIVKQVESTINSILFDRS